jgi:RHS repeat-associated protein
VTVNLTNNSAFKYDLNGNLTNDGLRNFVYDDENELIQVSVSNQWMSQFQYDGKMRRRVRKEFTYTNGAMALTNAVFYIYDGKLAVQERDQNNLTTAAYTRGIDLSGSFQRVGGIGGLLARTDDTLNQIAYYHADANGNVTTLVNSSNTIVAKYVYDSFGNVLSASGPLASANLYRFSSKEMHPLSGLTYYLYRYYDANLQRFLNKDPIAEKGGLNLYRFVYNAPSDYIDSYGCLVPPVSSSPVSAPPTWQGPYLNSPTSWGGTAVDAGEGFSLGDAALTVAGAVGGAVGAAGLGAEAIDTLEGVNDGDLNPGGVNGPPGFVNGTPSSSSVGQKGKSSGTPPPPKTPDCKDSYQDCRKRCHDDYDATGDVFELQYCIRRCNGGWHGPSPPRPPSATRRQK